MTDKTETSTLKSNRVAVLGKAVAWIVLGLIAAYLAYNAGFWIGEAAATPISHNNPLAGTYGPSALLPAVF